MKGNVPPGSTTSPVERHQLGQTKIIGGVTLVMVIVAVVACLPPARRAASIDPMEAVRLP
jgi:hypothetical protein